MRKFFLAATAAILSLTIFAGPAFAHATIQPSEVAAGGYAKLAVRVPVEKAEATVKVVVHFPEVFPNATYAPKQGWERTVTMTEAAEPVMLHGTPISTVIDTVTWEGGEIGAGEFDEFYFSAKVPDDAGELVFQIDQHYADGEVVSWAGAADADQPAARLTLVALGESGHDAAGELATLAAASDTAEHALIDAEGAQSSANIGIALGALGLLAGIGALVVAARKR